MSKKIKDFLKSVRSPEYVKSPDRNNPMDPWASKFESVEHIDETWQKDPALSKYLKSKGMDPRYVTRDQMISHAKTGDFEKWKNNHYDKARLTHGIESYTRKSTATIIKELYKRLRMEDMYDHEKEDKSISTYGKKPKFDKTDDKDSLGENKPKARAILTGGTTLTGEKREIVEFDPELKGRQNSSDSTKEKKDDKSKDKNSTK